MNILQGNALPSPDLVDGVNTTIWSIAREQVAIGHDVGVMIGEPFPAARVIADHYGLRLHVAKPTLRNYAEAFRRALTTKPDVVHLHSTFTPRLVIAAELARQAGVPVVTTPHGGLRPYMLGHGSGGQAAYARTIERRRFKQSAAITALLPAEMRDIRSFVPDFSGPLLQVPSPVEGIASPPTERHRGQGPVIFLGRLAMHGKGLDRFLEIARRMSSVPFEIYGEGPDRDELDRRRPPNVTIHPPVYGEHKAATLARAGLYLQVSRWEAFGISVGEAMLAGLPCAISDTIDLAPVFAEHDLGLLLPPDPAEAAEALAGVLADRERLSSWADAAGTYARRHFSNRAVASGYLQAYQLVTALAHENVGGAHGKRS